MIKSEKKEIRQGLANAVRLSGALNLLQDSILAETDTLRNAPQAKTPAKHPLIKWSSAAACLCLLAAGIMLWKQPATPGTKASDGITVSEDGVTIPPMKIRLSKPSENSAADMIAFFIYHGKSYVLYEYLYGKNDIVGEHLGTATGLIDEWTPREGNVEFAGSVSGDFYAVNGYDPSFMLCMKDSPESVVTYICNTGITLKYGSELYEDRLHLANSYSTIEYESRDSWYYGKKEIRRLNNSSVIEDFIKRLNAAQFMPDSQVPLKGGQSSIAETELYHLYFRMNNGTTVHLRLCEDGYVRYQGILPLCVRIPKESYDALLALLDNPAGH